MKIKALIVTRPVAGGMQNHLLTLLQGLDQEQFELHLACPGGSELSQLAEATGARIWTVDIADGLKPGLDRMAVVALRQVIKTIQPDLIHCHGFKAGLVGRLAAREIPAGVIQTVHNYPAWASGNQAARILLTAMERWLANSTGQFITVSQALKQETLKLAGVAEDKVEVIYNGIEAGAFLNGKKVAARLRLGLNPTRLVVGTVARLAPQKGIGVLLEAMPMLIQWHPGLKAILIGDGPEHKELLLKSLKLGISESVIFTGFRPDLPQILPALDVYVQPSLNEGLAISIIEAMAAGLPVVASRTGGIPELVWPGTTGLLAEPGNPRDLAEKINELLTNREKAARMAAQARERVTLEFDRDQMLARTTAVYVNVANRSQLSGLRSQESE